MSERPPPADQPPADVPLVRFRLRHMLLAMAGMSAFFAVLVSLHGYERIALLVGAAVIAGHVVATAIGFRLKHNAERRRQWQRMRGIVDLDESASRSPWSGARPLGIIPPNPLGDQVTRLTWLPILIGAGAVLGGLAGGLLLSATIGHRVTVAGLLLGAISTALLGAWLAFVMGGFVGISRHAWRDAVRNAKCDQVNARRRQAAE